MTDLVAVTISSESYLKFLRRIRLKPSMKWLVSTNRTSSPAANSGCKSTSCFQSRSLKRMRMLQRRNSTLKKKRESKSMRQRGKLIGSREMPTVAAEIIEDRKEAEGPSVAIMMTYLESNSVLSRRNSPPRNLKSSHLERAMMPIIQTQKHLLRSKMRETDSIKAWPHRREVNVKI